MRTPITIKALESLGFKDQLNGWGGSQGQGFSYRLKRGNLDVGVGTVDFTRDWVLMEPIRGGHAHPVVKFGDLEGLDAYCKEHFGEGILPLPSAP